jgi:hypothetical protein
MTQEQAIIKVERTMTGVRAHRSKAGVLSISGYDPSIPWNVTTEAKQAGYSERPWRAGTAFESRGEGWEKAIERMRTGCI